MAGDKDDPLKDEAAKRDDWRGPEGRVQKSGGQSLPAGEDKDERIGGGQGGGSGGEEPRGGFGIVPPPD